MKQAAVLCKRCNASLAEAPGSFWREPTIACSACGARHHRETRGERLFTAAIIAPFALFALVSWIVVLFMIIQIIRSGSWNLKLALIPIALAALCGFVSKTIIEAIRTLARSRELICIEK